jgi:hypothetical protein
MTVYKEEPNYVHSKLHNQLILKNISTQHKSKHKYSHLSTNPADTTATPRHNPKPTLRTVTVPIAPNMTDNKVAAPYETHPTPLTNTATCYVNTDPNIIHNSQTKQWLTANNNHSITTCLGAPQILTVPHPKSQCQILRHPRHTNVFQPVVYH